MTHYFPVVVEQEDNGTFSAWVAGLPRVYAAADTAAVAKRSIRSALAAHLRAIGQKGTAPHLKAELTVLGYQVEILSYKAIRRELGENNDCRHLCPQEH